MEESNNVIFVEGAVGLLLWTLPRFHYEAIVSLFFYLASIIC